MALVSAYDFVQSETSGITMNDEAKTKAQLMDELIAMRHCLSQLEALESQVQQRIQEINRLVDTPLNEANLEPSRSPNRPLALSCLLQSSFPSHSSSPQNVVSLNSSSRSQAEDTEVATIAYTVNLPRNPKKCQQHSIFSFPKHPQLDQIFAFIEANYDQPISLNEVAKTFNYSAAYLTSLVRRLTGKTLYQWIVQRRMFQARYLLISSNKSVRRIAEAVGYSDTGHFIKQFNQIHHQPPQSWRNSQRQLAS